MVQHLYATNVGSKLYGINTPTSDTDFKGFCFEDIDQIIGLKTFEQQNYDNKVADGPDKTEGCIYSVRRYISLCLKGNPTVIEIAFATEPYWMMSTPVGLEICQFVRDNFLTKHLFRPYSAYHRAQIRKLQSMDRKGKRKEMVDHYGYDLKFAMHAYRLARQCSIVMKEGTLRPTLDEADKNLCLELRAGKYTKEQALEILENVDKEMYECYKTSTLPDMPDFNKANKYVCSIYEKFLTGKYNEQRVEFKPFGDKTDNFITVVGEEKTDGTSTDTNTTSTTTTD